MKKLAYVMDMRLPNRYAHTIQIVKMSEAFALCGLKVELILPRRWQEPDLRKEDVWKFYSVKKNSFKITRLFCFDLFYIKRSRNPWFLRFRNLLAVSSFYLSVFVYLFFTNFDIFFTREYEALIIGGFIKTVKKIIVLFEAHVFPTVKYEKALISLGAKYADKILFTTDILKKKYEKNGLVRSNGFVAPSGVDKKFLNRDFSKSQARKRLKLSENEKLIIYTGQLFPWKGVETLVCSKKLLPDKWKIIIVGGEGKDIKRIWRLVKTKKIKGIILIGKVNYCQVFQYLKAADVLVLPNSNKFNISKEEASPMKLFEYMAAKRIIVASDAPALKEILVDNKNALLFKADSYKSLARTIKKAINNPKQSGQIANKAFQNVLQYTWEKRARIILEKI